MGDAEGQSSLAPLVLFLDENHCRNPYLLQVLEAAEVQAEPLLKHFSAGTPDVVWLPTVGANGWVLLTSDAKIRYNLLERAAVRKHRVRMVYFTRNDIAGPEMAKALGKALGQIQTMLRSQPPPFAASLTRTGKITVRDRFDED